MGYLVSVRDGSFVEGRGSVARFMSKVNDLSNQGITPNPWQTSQSAY